MPSVSQYEKDQLVNQFVKLHFGAEKDSFLGGPKLDTTRPNLHENKHDFQEEFDFVLKSSDDLFSLYHGLISYDEVEKFSPYGISFNFFSQALDRRKSERHPKTALDLILDNIRNVDYLAAMKRVIFDLYLSFSNRKSELEEQQKLFWSTQGRPPDHYARAIALRLAKLYGRQKYTKPTIGTSSDGDHPSTEFGRFLQELFEILEIETGFRLPAEWAIDQLTDEDVGMQNSLGLFDLLAQPNLGKFGPK